MDTKAKLEASLKDAMRSKDELNKRVLRMALSSVKLAEVNQGRSLEENEVLSLLQKEIKIRQEALAEAEEANRPDLVSEAIQEIAVLEGYLPAPLAPEELEAMARQAIAEVGATSPREMGQVMKVLIPRLEGRATGSQASQVVRQLLGG